MIIGRTTKKAREFKMMEIVIHLYVRKSGTSHGVDRHSRRSSQQFQTKSLLERDDASVVSSRVSPDPQGLGGQFGSGSTVSRCRCMFRFRTSSQRHGKERQAAQRFSRGWYRKVPATAQLPRIRNQRLTSKGKGRKGQACSTHGTYLHGLFRPPVTPVVWIQVPPEYSLPRH